MRTLYAFNMMTLDGFFSGPSGEIDWHNVDAEFGRFAEEQLAQTGILVFGRRTYELMAGYWTTKETIEGDPGTAGPMNDMEKIVVSTTLREADWQNTRVVSGAVVEELSRLKQAEGKDIAIFGSAELLAALQPAGVIDELRIMVNPVVLGGGVPLFKEEAGRLALKLEKSRQFKSGNVLLTYSTKA